MILESGLFQLLLGSAHAQWMSTADLSRGPIYPIMADGGAIFTESYGADSDGVDGGIFRTTDNGATWTAVTSGLSDPQSIRNPVFCEGRIFAGNEKGGFQSNDLGANWTPIDIGFNLPDPVYFCPPGDPGFSLLRADPSFFCDQTTAGIPGFSKIPFGLKTL